MKQYMKYLMTMVALLTMTVSTWATEITVNRLPDLQEPAGTVTYEVSGVVCTLTVIPSQHYHVGVENISVELSVSGNVAQAPRRSPDIYNAEVTADPEDATKFRFNIPDDNYDAVVTVTFQENSYPLTIKGKTVTEVNCEDVFGDEKVSFTPATTENGNVNTLWLNGADFSGNIVSGLGDLTINIIGENTLSGCVISSTNGGKLKMAKTGEEASLHLSNSSYGTSPVIMDFTSFELSEGLYLSNALTGIYSELDPAVYGPFVNSTGNNTFALINPTDLPTNNDRGIRDVTISTTVSYPIWIADHIKTVGASGLQDVYAQVTPANNANVLTGNNAGKVSFIPASAQNGNVNTLRINGAAITEGIVSNLPNLTIEFSGVSTLDKNGNAGFIYSGDPNAVLKMKALTSEGSITLYTANERAVVEGFADVEYVNAKPNYEGCFYDKENRKYMNQFGELSWLEITADTESSPYGLMIGDKVVNFFNAPDILEDGGTVSYDPDNFVLKLNGATIGSAENPQNITVSSSVLSVELNGTNRLHGGFVYAGDANEKCALTFITKATEPTTLTMNEVIPVGFSVVPRNNLEISDDQLTIMLIDHYDLTVNGIVVIPGNRLNILGDAGETKTAFFDGNKILRLNGATLTSISTAMPELDIYLAGDNKMTNAEGKIIIGTGSDATKISFNTIENPSGTLTFTSTSETDPTWENVFTNVNVTLNNNLTSDIKNKVVKIAVPVAPIVDNENDTTKKDYDNSEPSQKMGGGEGNGGIMIDNVVYTLDDNGTSGSPDGLGAGTSGNGGLAINSKVSEDNLNNALGLDPLSPEYAANFKGLTFLVLAGTGHIDIEAWSNTDPAGILCVKIGDDEPTVLTLTATPTTYTVAYAVEKDTYVRIYQPASSSSPAPVLKADHRIGPKPTVSTGVSGLSVTSNAIQTTPGPANTYRVMERATMAAAMSTLGNPFGGYTCSDPDITDLDDDMFLSDGGLLGAPRRASGQSLIIPEDLTFVDFTGTKITGMEVNRKSGPFNGVPENTFIYMPAGNTVAEGTKNVVIGDVCTDLELDGSTNAQPFQTIKNFKAAKATLMREFAAGGEKSKATIYLPYAIPQDDADNMGKFYEYTGNDGAVVYMKQVTTGGLKPNMPYIFEAKEGGVKNPSVLVVDVAPAPEYTEGFIGVYERKDYEPGMYCYAAEERDGIAVGQFVEMGPGSYVPPFRAYMMGSGTPVYAISWDGVIDDLENGDGNTTSVSEELRVKSEEFATAPVYNLNGQRVEKPTKGLYIVNGKKIVVK